MLAKQKNTQVDFSDSQLVFPEQVDFYIRDKNDLKLVPDNEGQFIVPRNLKEVVEKSSLFSDEDKKQFIFQ